MGWSPVVVTKQKRKTLQRPAFVGLFFDILEKLFIFV